MHYLQCLQRLFIHYLQCLHIQHFIYCQSQKKGQLQFVFLQHNVCIQYSNIHQDELWTSQCWTLCVFYSPKIIQNYAHDFRRNAWSTSRDISIILVRFLKPHLMGVKNIKFKKIKKGLLTASQLSNSHRPTTGKETWRKYWVQYCPLPLQKHQKI